MTECITSSLKENDVFLNEYIDGIPIPYDDYLEEHIFCIYIRVQMY
jgi:hypothetical protein